MADVRLSNTRKSILQSLENSGKHMGAEEIHDVLKKENPSIGIATVYRNLNYLYEHGLINRFQDKDVGYIYDVNVHDHYHFKCKQCGQVFDISMDYQKELDEKVAKRLGIQNVTHEIIFGGICKTCELKNTTD